MNSQKFLRGTFAGVSLAALLAACSPEQSTGQAPAEATEATRVSSPADRPATDEVIYFVLPDRFANGDPANDRGGIAGDIADHGFDPTHKGYFHGGDIKGITEKLDYIEGLGITAIWMTPIFKNKPVQGNPGDQSAGYHGYWITDFTQIDPHFGTNDDLKALVAAAHERGIKVIFDIITNHTADVIKYEECAGPDTGKVMLEQADCPYRPLGEPKYTAYVPAAEAGIKKPDWLNETRYYHNQGNSTFKGESSLYGDFAGLDDVDTDNPEVAAKMADIYKWWISEFRIDGFRIDTARHVNDEFWQSFAPAIIEHAKAEGLPNFYMFGEVYEFTPKQLSHFTNVAKLPAVLDFALQWTIQKSIVGIPEAENQQAIFSTGFQSETTPKAGFAPTQALADLFDGDIEYTGVAGKSATVLPTFLGNHDMGRFGFFLQQAHPDTDPAELLKRAELANALLFFARGVPVIYYGDEQGFTGDGGDQAARENMFPSQVESYNDNVLIGSDATTAEDNFNPDHPLYRQIATLATIRKAEPALMRGNQRTVAAGDTPGIFAFDRTDLASGNELVAAINTSTEEASAVLAVANPDGLTPVLSSGMAELAPDGTLRLAPLSYILYRRTN